MNLIYSSNLHVGGGVQVAASFLTELAKMEDAKCFCVYASSKVARNVQDLDLVRKCFAKFVIEDHYGFSIKALLFSVESFRYRKIFVIFGPKYFFGLYSRIIMGFAQPWIIYPNNLALRSISLWGRILLSMKMAIQKRLFFLADLLVVELPHVKKRLVDCGYSSRRIAVVPNCVSGIYFNEASWVRFPVPKFGDFLKVGFLGRNYVHKNTSIFPEIHHYLLKKFHVDVRFIVTFSAEEMAQTSTDFRAVCVNIGELDANQCPAFYSYIDIVIFPSVLECFSATPLESMIMRRPLVVSDLPFNRDICGDCALYFSPLSADSAADCIAQVINNPGDTQSRVELGFQRALTFANPNERARSYVSLFDHPDFLL